MSLDLRRVRTILRKEWEEVLRNGVVLFTLLFTPLVFVLVAVGSVVASIQAGGQTQQLGEREVEEIMKLGGELCTGLEPATCMAVYLATMMLLMFMMLPVILPTVFASYSVVGEKTGRTLEPLLATPVTTTELLLGKVLAAVIPAVLVTWLGVGLFFAAIGVMVPEVLPALLSPTWLAAVFVLGPLLAVAGVDSAVIISSRVTDPRTAQQLSGVVVIPLVLVLIGQSMGLFMVNQALVLVAIGACLVLDLVLTWVAVELFDREQVLTRWK